MKANVHVTAEAHGNPRLYTPPPHVTPVIWVLQSRAGTTSSADIRKYPVTRMIDGTYNMTNEQLRWLHYLLSPCENNSHFEVMKLPQIHTPWSPQDNKTPRAFQRRGRRALRVGERRDVKLVTWKAKPFQKWSGQPVVGVEFFPSVAAFRKRGENSKHRPLHSQ